MNLCVSVIIDLGKTHNKFYIFDYKSHKIKKLFIYKNQIIKNTKDYEVNLESIKKQINYTIFYALKRYEIKLINCCTHGSVVIGLDDKKKIISKISDENKYQQKVNKKFSELVSKSQNTYSPILDNGYNLLKTIFYLKKYKERVFKKISFFLAYPQFISYYLSNNISSEISYIGNHSFLWDFKKNTFSKLYYDFELNKFFKNFKRTHSKNGYLQKFFFNNNKYYKIPVLTGGHDSMSCLHHHKTIFKKKFILLSTGTWFVFFHPYIKIQNKEFYYSISSDKKKITTFRFPGGILYNKTIKKNYENESNYNLLFKLLDKKYFFYNKRSKRNNYSKKNFYYLFIIYLSLKTYHLLKKIGKLKYPIIIDGVGSKNKLFIKILSSIIEEQKIFISNDFHGVARGVLKNKNKNKNKHYILVKKNKLLKKKLISYYKLHKEKFN